MKWQSWVLALISSVAFAQPAKPLTAANPQADTRFVISGRTVDADSGQAVAGAAVSIMDVKSQAVRQAKTDENGAFVFRDLAAGKYALFGSSRRHFEQGFNFHENFSSAIVTGLGLQSDRYHLQASGKWGYPRESHR